MTKPHDVLELIITPCPRCEAKDKMISNLKAKLIDALAVFEGEPA